MLRAVGLTLALAVVLLVGIFAVIGAVALLQQLFQQVPH